MTPPLLARALVAAAAPPADYECVDGDLFEEYAQRAHRDGRVCADRWYWSQAIRSIPAWLSYSRSYSLAATVKGSLAIAAAVLAMLIANEFIDDAIRSVYHAVTGTGAWPFFLAGWANAACFGAAIVMMVKSQGARAAIAASAFLLAFVAVPILLGFSSRLSPQAWLLLIGAVPCMIAGGCTYRIALRNKGT